MPKYLVSLVTGMFALFKLIKGKLPWRRAKVTLVELDIIHKNVNLFINDLE